MAHVSPQIPEPDLRLDRSAPARLASLSEITTLFTDQPLPPDLARKCEAWGTGVQVAG